MNVRVAALKLIQYGRAEPSPETGAVGQHVAVNVREGVRRDLEAPGLVLWQRLIGNGLCHAGTSLTGVTVNRKVSETETELSLAVTLRSSAPLKLAGGVPEKVWVAASKVTESGKTEPSPRLAL